MASEAAKKIVDLFYLGGVGSRPGSPAYVSVGGDAYVLPEPGTPLRVPLFVAQDIIKKYNDRFVKFSLQPHTAPVVAAPATREFTREELLEMLARFNPPAEDSAVPDFLEGQPDADLTPEPTPTPAPRKGSKKAATTEQEPSADAKEPAKE